MRGSALGAAGRMATCLLCVLSTNLGAQVLPNIVVVMADDMGIGDTSAYLGKKLGPNDPNISTTLVTPSLERLASQGMLFTDVHTASPTCSPSRYALLTGRYPWRTYNKHKVIGSWSAPPLIAPERPTLATLLGQNGYRTAAFGKWHLGLTFMDSDGQPIAFSEGNQANWNKVQTGKAANGSYLQSLYDGPLAHGFDEFFGLGGNFYLDAGSSLKAFIENNAFRGIPTWKGAPGPDSAGPGVPDWDEERLGEQYISAALDFLDGQAAGDAYQPFFIYYAPNANHDPHSPPAEIVVQGQTIPIRNQARLSNGRDGTTRDDMVYQNDVAVGLLLDKLAALDDPRTGRPMLESTLFIFTSDNGGDRGEGSVAHAGLRGKKGALYEGGHRVPFIVAWPEGGVPADTVSRALFGQVDLYASFAELLGHTLQLDEAEDSANVLPALLGQVPHLTFQRSHSLVVHDDRQVNNDLPDDSLMLIREQSTAMMINGNLINRNRLSDASRGQPVPIRLYDLDADLYQQNNRLGAAQQEPLVAALSERLLRFHNQGFSRPLATAVGPEPVLLSDGGISLRNNRSGAVGYEFTVRAEPVRLNSLGLWDDGAVDRSAQENTKSSDGQTSGIPDGLAMEHVVRLFDGVTRELLAAATVGNDNSYLDGEFRYVDLQQPVVLAAGHTYALTVDTAPGDGDQFHHFAAYTAVSPIPTSRVGNFIARIASAADGYPDRYPDGDDGEFNRHPDMFRHRMFVGPNARLEPAMIDPNGTPNYSATGDRAVFIWRAADESWRLRATGGGQRADYSGSISADRPLSFVRPFSIEPNDVIDTGDSQNVTLSLTTSVGQDGIDFGLQTDANSCVRLQLPTSAGVLIGAARTPVTPPFNLTDFGPCETGGPGVNPDGTPVYDPVTDRAIYLWREADGSWRLRAVGGGAWAKYVGTLTAGRPFTDVRPFSLEGRDDVDTSDPRRVNFTLGVTKAGEDGIEFSVPGGTTACLEVTAPWDAKVRVGPERERVRTPFNLTDFGPCD